MTFEEAHALISSGRATLDSLRPQLDASVTGRPERMDVLSRLQPQMAPRMGGHPGAQQGGVSPADAVKQQQLMMALTGRVDPLATNTVAAGLNIDPAAVRSPQGTLSAILARGRMEGAPPAPYETKFANMGDLTTALLNQTVDPRIRGQAEQSLLSSIQQSGKVPSSVLEAAFRSR